jgi:ribosomal protein S17E
MTHVPNVALKQMVAGLDPRMKQQVSDIINRKVTHEVRCMSKKCKGALAGYVYHTMNRDYADIHDPDAKKTGILRVRKRFDGEWGFKCICGNDSIMADEEKGNIPVHTRLKPVKNLEPTPAQLSKIADNISNRKTPYETVDGVREVDGFKLVEVT